MVASVAFDLDDIDAAFAELDARYLAGEAAAYAHTWSVIAGTYAAFNRHDSHDPSSVVNIDHRRVARFAPGDLTAANTMDLMPNLRAYIESVHRLERSWSRRHLVSPLRPRKKALKPSGGRS